MQVCGESETAEQAIQLIRRLTPDLVIVDITLKGSSGLELIKGIRALSIGIPILVLSMHEESLYAERALRAGATGYITKNQAADEVLAAIRRVLTGEIYLSDKMTSVFLRSLTTAGAKSIATTCRSLGGPRTGSPGVDRARQYDASDRGQTSTRSRHRGHLPGEDQRKNEFPERH